MKRITIKSCVLDYWKDQGRVCTFSELKTVYDSSSSLIYGNKRCSPAYSGITLLRILRKHGIKTGLPGTKTPWVLRKENCSCTK